LISRLVERGYEGEEQILELKWELVHLKGDEGEVTELVKSKELLEEVKKMTRRVQKVKARRRKWLSRMTSKGFIKPDGH